MDVDIFSIKTFSDLIELAITETHGIFGPLFLMAFVLLVTHLLWKKFDLLVSLFLSLTINILTLLLLIWIGALDHHAIVVYVILLSLVGTIAWISK